MVLAFSPIVEMKVPQDLTTFKKLSNLNIEMTGRVAVIPQESNRIGTLFWCKRFLRNEKGGKNSGMEGVKRA